MWMDIDCKTCGTDWAKASIRERERERERERGQVLHPECA